MQARVNYWLGQHLPGNALCQPSCSIFHCHLCRFPPATKAAILVTLGQLIRRAGAGLKPFVPQLQTTFVKCLNDQVGREGGWNAEATGFQAKLGRLMCDHVL